MGICARRPSFYEASKWLAYYFLVSHPVSFKMHWLSSVTYVSALSLWALVSGHWSAWQAARVEVNQEVESKKRDKENIPEEVAQKVVKKLKRTTPKN